MNKHLIAFILIMALAAMFVPTSAEAAQNRPQKVYPPGSTYNAWQNILGLETLSTVTFSMQPYDHFWAFAVADSMGVGGADTINVVIQYRWRHSLAVNPAAYYYGAWTAWDTLTQVDSLYAGSLWTTASQDTITYHNDVQLRAFGLTTNDSSKIRVYVIKRIGD